MLTLELVGQKELTPELADAVARAVGQDVLLYSHSEKVFIEFERMRDGSLAATLAMTALSTAGIESREAEDRFAVILRRSESHAFWMQVLGYLLIGVFLGIVVGLVIQRWL